MLLNESINDIGLFKAVFIVGIPYAGKSYISSKLSGQVEPRIVNTDKPFEFLMKGKYHVDYSSKREHIDRAKILNKKSLYQYVNGMLPLMVDGTSENAHLIKSRIGILKYLGYDVAIIFVDVDLDKALSRTASRERPVPPEHVRIVYEAHEKTKSLLSSETPHIFHVENNGDLDDLFLDEVYKKTMSFYESKIENDTGKELVRRLLERDKKYLADIIPQEDIVLQLSKWYAK